MVGNVADMVSLVVFEVIAFSAILIGVSCYLIHIVGKIDKKLKSEEEPVTRKELKELLEKIQK